MNRLIFEGRFLVNMTGSIMRQDDLRLVHSRIDWEKMYRTADYHKIANMVYLGILGNGEGVPERWQNRFFERYQESLRFSEICKEAEKEILMMLDMMKMPCTILTDINIRGLYKLQETAANNSLRLFLDEESYTLVKGYLVDLGYETDERYPEYGERLRRNITSFSVEIYYQLPFRTAIYRKNMAFLLESAFIMPPYKYVRTMSLENRFIFRMAQAVYHYVTDGLLIREVMDLFQYHKTWRGRMNQEYIDRKLKAFHIDELADKLLRVSYMWFGTKEESRFEQLPEDMGVYDIVENRILSMGAIRKEADKQALILERLINKEIEKERRMEKWESFHKRYREIRDNFMRKLRWIFPEYRYMCALYPTLEKIPILLPFCWLRRGMRFIREMFSGHGSEQP